MTGAQLTYSHVGETLRTNLVDRPIPRYRSLERTAIVGHGRADFERASEAILRWGIQTGSGMRVAGVTGAPLVKGDRVRLAIPFGPLRVGAPAEVVYVVNEPNRAGFAYGTLPGHPEQGEEAFLADIADDGTVSVTIRAFSRPASWFWWLGAPVLRFAQWLYTGRYLRALA